MRLSMQGACTEEVVTKQGRGALHSSKAFHDPRGPPSYPWWVTMHCCSHICSVCVQSCPILLQVKTNKNSGTWRPCSPLSCQLSLGPSSLSCPMQCHFPNKSVSTSVRSQCGEVPAPPPPKPKPLQGPGPLRHPWTLSAWQRASAGLIT